MPSQTYTATHSQHKLFQFTHPSQSLFHFIPLQFLFSHSTLQEDTTRVRNMLRTHQHNCSQCAESARTRSTQHSALETSAHTNCLTDNKAMSTSRVESSLVPSPPLPLTKWPQKKWSGIFGPIPWFSTSQNILANQIAARSRVYQKLHTNLEAE